MATAVVVGSINKDIVAFVDRHPAPGETVLARHAGQHPGGKGANQAVAIARLKRDADQVRMIGRVGDDVFGPELLVFLAGEGIDTSGFASVAGVGTGLGLITVDARAENVITVVPGANHRWPDALPAIPLAPSDIVVCQLEVPLHVVAHAFAEAKRQRAMTLLNPAPFQPIPDDILHQTDIVILNESEMAQCLGRAVEDLDDKRMIPAARDLMAQGPGTVVVTLGKAGALVVDAAARASRIPGRPVQALDTTGAGDCFVGAFAAALMAGIELLEAATFANAAAAISVTRAGAASSIPRRTEVAV
jgi:ribokinase